MRSYIDIDGNEICVEDVLDELDVDDVLDYYGVEATEDGVDASDLDEDNIIDYLEGEYQRGAFSDFDFDKLFTALGIKDALKNN